MARTELHETQLVELRANGQLLRTVFVDSCMLHHCMTVLNRRGEEWAASVLGRDLSRRSVAVPNRPYLHGGEDITLVEADRAEDDAVVTALAEGLA